MNKTIENEPEFVKETLAWCNKKREEKGLAPLDRMPKGRKYDEVSCPCGAACGLWVGREYAARDRANLYGYSLPPNVDPVREKLPNYVSTFVDEFDEGRLPQYILQKEDTPPEHE